MSYIKSINYKKQYWAQSLLALFILCTTFFIFYNILSLFIYLLLGLIISYLISPVLHYLETLGIHKKISLPLVFLLLITSSSLLMISITPFVIDNLYQLKAELPGYIEGTKRLLEKADTAILKTTKLPLSFQNISLDVEGQITRGAQFIAENVTGVLSTLIISPIFAYFILQDGQRIAKRVITFIPNNLFESSLAIYYKLSQQFKDFIRARLLEAVVVGVIVWAGLLMVGSSYSISLGLFAGIANLIPYIGPIIGAVPAVLISFVEGKPWSYIGVELFIYGFAQLVDTVILIPIFVAKAVGLHALTVIISIIIGASWGGILGMIIAIPVANALKIILKTIYSYGFNKG